MAEDGFLRRAVLEPLARQLTQGVTPRRLALALALGLVLGAFPVLGTTTLLCAAVGVALRLNQPALQVANYVAYPLQLGLLLPFFDAGARLFGLPPVPFTLDELRRQVAADGWATLARYAGANARAAVAWAVVAPLAAGVLYLVLWAVLAWARRPR
ncbi:MAG: DUF2062 domain-containing protein [Anaeromyxobacter sp.]